MTIMLNNITYILIVFAVRLINDELTYGLIDFIIIINQIKRLISY